MNQKSLLSRAAPFVVLGLSVAIAACGGRSASGRAPSTAERGRAVNGAAEGKDDQTRCEWKGREDRETSETAGAGAVQPNVRRVYQVVGSGEDRRKVIACREVDTNLDGIKDVFRTYNEKGEAVSEQADSNYDGKIDTWISFTSGRISKVAFDTNNDGQPDVWKYYIGGQLSRIQRDTNFDGKPDVWEYYASGRLERIGVDVDFDGSVDRWDRDEVARRAQEAADRAAERSSGGAKLDATGSASAVAAEGISGPPSASASASANPKGKQSRDKTKGK